MPAKTKKEPKKNEDHMKGVSDDEEFEKALKTNEPKDKCFSQKPPKSK
jgi:hypothetical protein